MRPVQCVVAGLVAALAPGLLAGPLDPPAGPIASTAKPLAEVEPRTAINSTNTPGDADSVYKITSPGSYYLTANMSVPTGRSAIEIAASNVTIDLGGFTITSIATLDAIRLSTDSRSNISVRNGNIGTCFGGGIDVRPAGAGVVATVGGTIENVHVYNTSGVGVRAGDSMSLINVSVGSAGNTGISAGDGCTLIGCTATGNDDNGINAGFNCSLSDCDASGNHASGLNALYGSTVSRCGARANDLNGIVVASGSTVTDCSSRENLGVGFFISGGSTVSHCTGNSNGTFGFFGDALAVSITDCTAWGNDSDGFNLAVGSVVSRCAAMANAGDGIDVDDGSEVIGCTAYQNTLDGIRCSDRCVVKDSTCTGNGSGAGIAAGIHATGGNNRIDSNHCGANDFGVDVDGAGNVIVRNTCSDNTQNFVINPNNIYGAIIDRSSPGTPAVVGSAAAGTMGSTDPSANFSH